MCENAPSIAGVIMETVSCSRLGCRLHHGADKKNVTVNESLMGCGDTLLYTEMSLEDMGQIR